MSYQGPIHFVNAATDRLLEALSRTWLDTSGSWRLLPDASPDLATLREQSGRAGALADGSPPLLQAGQLAPAALLVSSGKPTHNTLYLSTVAWHTLMLNWPLDDAMGLGIVAQGAPDAMRPGAGLVALTLTDAQWAHIGQAATNALGTTTIPTASDAAITDLGSLHTALIAATGRADLVIAEASPFDDGNRYARFGLAIEHTDGVPQSILRGNAGRNVLDGGEGIDTVVLDAPLQAFQFLRRESDGAVLVGHRDPALGKADLLINVERIRIADSGELIDLKTLAMPTVMDYLAQHPEVAAQAGGGNEAAAAAHYLGQGQQQGLTTGIREVSVPIGGATGGAGSGPIVVPPINQWIAASSGPSLAELWGAQASNPLAAASAGSVGQSALDTLSATGLAQLIDAMASVAPPAAAATTWNPQQANPLLALGVWG